MSSAGVQSRGRLVQEENRGVDDELHTDVCPLPLSSGDPPAHLCAHLRRKPPCANQPLQSTRLESMVKNKRVDINLGVGHLGETQL